MQSMKYIRCFGGAGSSAKSNSFENCVLHRKCRLLGPQQSTITMFVNYNLNLRVFTVNRCVTSAKVTENARKANFQRGNAIKFKNLMRKPKILQEISQFRIT